MLCVKTICHSVFIFFMWRREMWRVEKERNGVVVFIIVKSSLLVYCTLNSTKMCFILPEGTGEIGEVRVNGFLKDPEHRLFSQPVSSQCSSLPATEKSLNNIQLMSDPAYFLSRISSCRLTCLLSPYLAKMPTHSLSRVSGGAAGRPAGSPPTWPGCQPTPCPGYTVLQVDHLALSLPG